VEWGIGHIPWRTPNLEPMYHSSQPLRGKQLRSSWHSTGTIESYEMDLLHRDDDDSDDDGDGDGEEDDVVSQFSFREYCTQLRNNNPAVLPAPGTSFRLHPLLNASKRIQLADVLIQSAPFIKHIALSTNDYYAEEGNDDDRSARAIGTYLSASKYLKRVDLSHTFLDRILRSGSTIFSC
jgi:hypothetical protein